MHERIIKGFGFVAISGITLSPVGEFHTTQSQYTSPTQAVLPSELPFNRLPEGIKIETDKDLHKKRCVLPPSQAFTKGSRCR